METNDMRGGSPAETPGNWEREGAGSRYRLQGYSPSVKVVLGWDRPLSTYFAQVWEVPEGAGHHEEGTLLLWLGCSWKEVPTGAGLADALERYAPVPGELADLLHADEVASRFGPPPRLEPERANKA